MPLDPYRHNNMSWEDFITYVLTTTTKVEKLAVYDMRGRPVATTEDMDTSDSEGMALIRCLRDQSKTMTKLSVDNTMFLCIQGIDNTFIGTSLKDSSRVIVARSDVDHLIAVIGQAEDRGSFISELKHALHLKAEGKLLSQQQLQQSQQLIPVDPSAASAAVGGAAAATAVTAEHVLIDLHG